MERVRAALLDAGAEEKLWAEALSSVIHVLNRSPKAGQDVTPLEALTGRRPDVKGFRVWGSRASALRPKQQQRKLKPRTDVGRFVGYRISNLCAPRTAASSVASRSFFFSTAPRSVFFLPETHLACASSTFAAAICHRDGLCQSGSQGAARCGRDFRFSSPSRGTVPSRRDS